jgi:3-oxoacyl-[acyl-carrier protein] reductase
MVEFLMKELPMTDQLAGRTVFITGSGGVLGSTYVRRMLAAGARVVATDLPGHRARRWCGA